MASDSENEGEKNGKRKKVALTEAEEYAKLTDEQKMISILLHVRAILREQGKQTELLKSINTFVIIFFIITILGGLINFINQLI